MDKMDVQEEKEPVASRDVEMSDAPATDNATAKVASTEEPKTTPAAPASADKGKGKASASASGTSTVPESSPWYPWASQAEHEEAASKDHGLRRGILS